MKLFKNIFKILALNSLLALSAMAHIGSAGVIYEGKAGPYQIQVFITPPDVIPGTATVSVLIDELGIKRVGLKPIFYWGGEDSTPQAEDALHSATEIGKYEGVVWLMQSGAAAIKVEIEGTRGKASALIPIAAVATAKRDLSAGLGWILAGLALLLVGLMTTIIGASNSDSLLKPGQSQSSNVMKRRITGSIVGACFCGLALFGGNLWWKAEADSYNRDMYRSFTSKTEVINENGQQKLSLQIDSLSVNGRSLNYLIPDHGKLMHLFLVKKGTMDAFAHLHPVRKDSLHFEALLPNLPAGQYLLYADVLRYHGFQYTIADSINIPAITTKQVANANIDPDDTYVITNPLKSQKPVLAAQSISICGTPGVKTALQDGSSIVWEEKPNQALKTGQVYNLKFSVVAPDGQKADLEPYLGMMGHAAVLKDDGSVYIHLHPNGTFSTTSVTAMQNRLTVENKEKSKARYNKRISDGTAQPKLLSPEAFKDSVNTVMAKLANMTETERNTLLMQGMNHTNDQHHEGMVSFPYAFPTEGNYRIWLQIKRKGKILTGIFDAKVGR